ncbi:hypothetical protein FS749_014160, partial [Ceratobasidium sp. UAMH 11750]
VFAEGIPFFSLQVSDAVRQIRAGIPPCPPEQYSRVDPRALPIIQSMLVQAPATRLSARDVLQRVSQIL